MTLEYKQSLKEVDTILNFMEKKYTDKLPNKLIRFIKENMDNSYISNINVNIPINKQLLKENTKLLLSLIYRNYWCDEEKKKELFEEDAYLKSQKEKENYEKYNPDNIFESKQLEINSKDNSSKSNNIVEYKESIFKRVVNKIRRMLRLY